MTGDQVVPLRPAPQPAAAPAPARRPGYAGLIWSARYHRDTRTWWVEGETPDVPGIYPAGLPVKHRASWLTAEEMARVTAALLNDLGEDAGSLMADALMQEGNDQ